MDRKGECLTSSTECEKESNNEIVEMDLIQENSVNDRNCLEDEKIMCKRLSLSTFSYPFKPFNHEALLENIPSIWNERLILSDFADHELNKKNKIIAKVPLNLFLSEEFSIMKIVNN